MSLLMCLVIVLSIGILENDFFLIKKFHELLSNVLKIKLENRFRRCQPIFCSQYKSNSVGKLIVKFAEYEV